MMTLGVDPGKTGGIVLLSGDTIAEAMRIPFAKPIERAWLVGGKHAEQRFTVDIVNNHLLYNLAQEHDLPGRCAVYVEEPSLGGSARKFSRFNAETGETDEVPGSNRGADASINRSYQGVAQALAGTIGHPSAVSPQHWQAVLFKQVPVVVVGDSLASLGVPGDTKLNKKQRAMLACLMCFGVAECTAKLRHKKSAKLDSGMCDAACVALFGQLHQNYTPKLLRYSRSLLCEKLGIRA